MPEQMCICSKYKIYFAVMFRVELSITVKEKWDISQTCGRGINLNKIPLIWYDAMLEWFKTRRLCQVDGFIETE